MMNKKLILLYLSLIASAANSAKKAVLFDRVYLCPVPKVVHKHEFFNPMHGLPKNLTDEIQAEIDGFIEPIPVFKNLSALFDSETKKESLFGFQEAIMIIAKRIKSDNKFKKNTLSIEELYSAVAQTLKRKCEAAGDAEDNFEITLLFQKAVENDSDLDRFLAIFHVACNKDPKQLPIIFEAIFNIKRIGTILKLFESKTMQKEGENYNKSSSRLLFDSILLDFVLNYKVKENWTTFTIAEITIELAKEKDIISEIEKNELSKKDKMKLSIARKKVTSLVDRLALEVKKDQKFESEEAVLPMLALFQPFKNVLKKIKVDGENDWIYEPEFISKSEDHISLNPYKDKDKQSFLKEIIDIYETILSIEAIPPSRYFSLYKETIFTIFKNFMDSISKNLGKKFHKKYFSFGVNELRKINLNSKLQNHLADSDSHLNGASSSSKTTMVDDLTSSLADRPNNPNPTQDSEASDDEEIVLSQSLILQV